MKRTANVTKKMNSRYLKTFLSTGVLFCLLIFLFSCGGPSVQEQLIGEWLVKDYEKIIILNANGTWTLKQEKTDSEKESSANSEKKDKTGNEDKKPAEGKDEGGKSGEEKKEQGKGSEGEKKSGEDSSGLWDIKDKTFMISAEKDVPELEWKNGDKFDFEIVEITPDLLKLKDTKGNDSEWERVREEKKEDGKGGESKEAKPIVVEGEPMIINLVQKLQYGKERYLCIKIDYHFRQPEPDHSVGTQEKEKKKDEKEGSAEPYKYQFIHPEVKDAIIMHLGEMQYRDIRNYDKIQGLRAGIEKRIAPYFAGELTGVTISDAIITSSRESIDQFLGQYEPPPEKNESGGDEKGKKEGKQAEKKSGH